MESDQKQHYAYAPTKIECFCGAFVIVYRDDLVFFFGK
jgi:hypothetical protein